MRTQPPHASAAPSLTPSAEDVVSIDAILGALYASISGPPGDRDWDRLRSLFVPGGRLARTVRDGGNVTLLWLTPDEFIERARPALAETGFFESEIARVVDVFGAIAHVFSTYVARRFEDEAPFARGINSIQLFSDGPRWYIASLVWDDEAPERAIPPAYAGPAAG